MKKSAFTLIELLVVISVLGILVVVLLPNLVGVRARARDSARKNDLRQLKAALRMYYNDFQTYPDHSETGAIEGCGETGTEECPNSDGSFAAGEVVYMKKIDTVEFNYVQVASGDDFLLSAVLENASDTDIATSVEHCNVASPISATYYVCAD